MTGDYTIYYTATIGLSVASMIILCILTYENNGLTKQRKRAFYLTYILIAAAAIAECAGVWLNGRENVLKWLLPAVKCADYILTPMIGYAMVKQLELRNRLYIGLKMLITANTVFQLIACFNGWMIQIDEHNHFTHGPLYGVYIFVCLSVAAIVLVEFVVGTRDFQTRKRKSLCVIALMIAAGVGLQELFAVHTSYAALAIGAALLFIRYSDFYQTIAYETIDKQEELLSKDALTGALSRYAYSKALEGYDASKDVPDGFAVFSIDIDGLKSVNDTLGHLAGDELICGAVSCIKNTFGESASCFRIGGDEFVVFGIMDREEAEAALAKLVKETENWSGALLDKLHLAAGYALASDHVGISVENLVRESDRAMYANKRAHYQSSDEERKRAPTS